MANPPSTTTTIQSTNVSPHANTFDDYRMAKPSTKAMNIENTIKIENIETRRDSQERITQLGSSNSRSHATIFRQSSQSPAERKITITYDTTKRIFNNNNFSKTANKPHTGDPIEVVTRISQNTSPRNTCGHGATTEAQTHSASR
jgi:hypothetical protein